MEKIVTNFKDVFLIKPAVFEDNRGFFMESYSKEKFEKLDIHFEFLQDNHSLSKEKGVLRGLHYQLAPKAQTKLVRVIAGSIYDVIVDMRRNSPTCGMWQGFELSAENKLQLLIPKGFAHGFVTLTDNVEVQYKVDEFYSAEHDRGIAWDDPFLNINWEISNPILSDKDKNHPSFLDAENNFL